MLGRDSCPARLAAPAVAFAPLRWSGWSVCSPGSAGMLMNAAGGPRMVAGLDPTAPRLHCPAIRAAQAPLSLRPEVTARDHANQGFFLRPSLDFHCRLRAPRLGIWVPGFYFQFFLRPSSVGPLKMTLETTSSLLSSSLS